MRCRFFEDGTGVDYVKPFDLGSAITSAGLGKVIRVGSNLESEYSPGDIVVDGAFGWPWSHVAEIDPASPDVYLAKIPSALEYIASPTATLSVIGQPGLTAYFGIERFARPSSGELIVVSSAAGAVGTVVCQLAKRRGCKVIGLTSSDEKATFLTERVGCDVGLNYRSKDFAAELDAACNGSVDWFWDSVGGSISEDVIRQMADDSTIILCGQISDYDSTNEYPPPLSKELAHFVDSRNITRHRHLVLQYEDETMNALRDLALLVASGELTHFETSEFGLENAGLAYEKMMNGGNVGKQIVHGAALPPANSLKRKAGQALGRFGYSLTSPMNVGMYCGLLGSAYLALNML